MAILKCFESVSSLKINLQKSRLFGVSVDSQVVNSIVQTLGCSPATLPFTYLGMPIGLRMGRTEHWDSVVMKIKDRLFSWKLNSLSIGGRQTLIKSFLGSLPLYFLSVFRAPIAVVKKMESLRNNFFWANTRGKKINWANYHKLFAITEHEI